MNTHTHARAPHEVRHLHAHALNTSRVRTLARGCSHKQTRSHARASLAGAPRPRAASCASRSLRSPCTCLLKSGMAGSPSCGLRPASRVSLQTWHYPACWSCSRSCRRCAAARAMRSTCERRMSLEEALSGAGGGALCGARQHAPGPALTDAAWVLPCPSTCKHACCSCKHAWPGAGAGQRRGGVEVVQETRAGAAPRHPTIHHSITHAAVGLHPPYTAAQLHLASTKEASLGEPGRRLSGSRCRSPFAPAVL